MSVTPVSALSKIPTFRPTATPRRCRCRERVGAGQNPSSSSGFTPQDFLSVHGRGLALHWQPSRFDLRSLLKQNLTKLENEISNLICSSAETAPT